MSFGPDRSPRRRRALGQYHPELDKCSPPQNVQPIPQPVRPPDPGFGPAGGASGFPGGSGGSGGGGLTPAQLETVLRRLLGDTFQHVQPSPLVEPSYSADVLELTARNVIGPPTAPGNADATTGATEMAAAESALTGTTVTVLTPATTAAYVTVLTYQVQPGRVTYVKNIGANGHDYLASRDMISWRIRVGDRVELNDTELGILGGVDNPIRVHALAFEGETITVECRNRDANSASLVEMRLSGWTMPTKSQERRFSSLMDRDQ